MPSLQLISDHATKIKENPTPQLKTCSTECTLKYDYKSSSSFKACINDTSLGFPYFPNIKITNQTLSDSTLPTPSVYFNNVKYHFYEMYLTDGCYNLFTYDNNFGIGSTDISMCACLLMHRDETFKNNLLIYIPIIASDNNTNQYITGTAGEIINKIITDASGDICPLSSQSTIASTFSLNDLIPSQNFYWLQISNFNFVIFSAIDSIYISNTTKKQITSYFTSKINGLRNTTTPGINNYKNLFKSTNPPINTLSSGEDEIYIQCQPTDQEGELIDTGIPKVPTTETRTNLTDLDNFKIDEWLKNNTFVSIIIGIILMIVLIKGAEFLFKSSTGTFLNNL